MKGFKLGIAKWVIDNSSLKKFYDYEKGYLNRLLLKDVLINHLFQKIFRLNSDTPWSVKFTSRVTGSDKIRMGKNVWKSFAVSGNCYIQGINGILIGDDTIFGPGVGIISANHNPHDLDKWIATEPIQIGKSCWIGMNSVILPGVKLGDNVIVGAGSVVTKSFPDNVVIAGNPAKIISSSKKVK